MREGRPPEAVSGQPGEQSRQIIARSQIVQLYWRWKICKCAVGPASLSWSERAQGMDGVMGKCIPTDGEGRGGWTIGPHVDGLGVYEKCAQSSPRTVALALPTRIAGAALNILF